MLNYSMKGMAYAVDEGANTCVGSFDYSESYSSDPEVHQNSTSAK